MLIRPTHLLLSILLALAATAAAGCAASAPAPATLPAIVAPQQVQLHLGDLLFQDADAGPLCDAIEAVTTGYGNTRMSHVGMVSQVHPQVLILEAVGRGVIETPLEKFLSRSHDPHGRPKVLIGRLHPDYRPLIPAATAYARSKIGRPYDHLFRIDEDSYYCSELIYFAFRHASGGRDIFSLHPMTFNDPATGQPFPAWRDYFAKLQQPIPESQPGLNPGSMSRERSIEIIAALGELGRKYTTPPPLSPDP